MIRITHIQHAGPALADLRHARRVSQLTIAAQAGFDRAQICNWEKGRKVPHLGTLIRLADALGCDVALIPREDA